MSIYVLTSVVDNNSGEADAFVATTTELTRVPEWKKYLEYSYRPVIHVFGADGKELWSLDLKGFLDQL